MDAKLLCAAVDKHRKRILDAEQYIWKHPETGYREVKTAKYLEEQFKKLGYEPMLAGDVPGFCAVLDTGKPGPEVLVLGEMDSLLCPEHPDCDEKTGAVHCCGHHAQSAALLGIAAALKEQGVTDGLCGRIRLCAVPAEELIEIEYRMELRKKGVIRYFGGKQEFLRRGLFKDVDLAFMVHTSQGENFSVRQGSVGFLSKQVRYKGVSAHAGAAPYRGRNALYAATLGLQAVNSIRETFKDSDMIRVHPVITKGGDAVNAIPGDVRIESYVRGLTFEAIEEANRRVNRALIGAALSLGTNVDVIDLPGYAPLQNCRALQAAAGEALCACMPEREFLIRDSFGTGSTDMGDLSQVMPVVHPYVPGASGRSHGADYRIVDAETACVASAKWQLCLLHVLLGDGARRAKEICAAYEPPFPSQEAYLAYLERISSEGDRISYTEDETAAQVRL